MQNNRNYFIAIALSVLIVLAWQFFYMNPRIEQQRLAEEARLAQQAQTEAASQASGAQTGGAVDGSLPNGAVGAAADLSRDQSVAQSQRVTIDTPALSGSLNLTGARLDDLRLKEYHVTVDDSSPLVTLLNPADTRDGYFAEIGFIAGENTGSVPGPNTVWTLASGNELTQSSPVTLTYTNEAGVTFERKISVDEHYMFTFEDTVRNDSASAATFAQYGRVTRYNKPTTAAVFVIHEGFLGVIGTEGSLSEHSYSDIEDANVANEKATGGWLGITDKYWATSLIPSQTLPYESRFSHFTDGTPRFQADFRSDALTVPAGQSTTVETLVFAGAKRVPVIDGYDAQLSIPKFDLMIDWGWFYFITKPMFKMMDYFYHLIGNFGVAILLTTIVVKIIFFPLANKQYASMANMKRVQPKLEELKAKHGSDRMALQQAMMELYKTEKINPVAGCWPILLQIPVFFALYKVIYVTIEMRHAPFFGWIQDLSAPDPTSVINLFGLLPFDSPGFLHLGVWPIIMGITMWVQMRMNPTPPDPTQAMLFNWMPVLFTFMLGSFPAGLVIYWAWNNTLSILQQAVIMRRHGVKIELFSNIANTFRRKPAETK